MNSISEVFDMAEVLAKQPRPSGCRLSIVTNAGGPGILGVDACEAAGLRVSPFTTATLAAMVVAMGVALVIVR